MLSKRDGNHVVDVVQSKWPNKPKFKAKGIRTVEIDEESSLLIGEEFTAVKLSEDILPFLKIEKLLETFGKIVVDKGAIRYVCNGANVMRPGVVQVEGEFKSGDIVAVKEEQHGKILAVGFALTDSSEIQTMSKGVVLKNMHYIGDKFWEAHKTIG
ncbi:MAG: PUA domain-containing protein [Nitrososphaerales archaeon]